VQQALDDSGESAGKGVAMKPLRLRLQQAREEFGIPWEVLERDYLLSWLLAGIGQVDILRKLIVFKGGTALKKCYFGDYRFSEDLDFSGLEGVPTGSSLEQEINKACDATVALLDSYTPVELTCHRYTEKEPHPGGQEAFTIRARFPWHRKPHTRVMVEITLDEPVLKSISSRKIMHGYGETLDAKIQVYALEEIVAEKLRAILQHQLKLKERGWSRSRARDYYDLWRVLGAYRHQMDLSDLPALLQKKCSVRKVAFKDAEDFFRDPMLAYVRQTWSQWLGPLIPELPELDTVIGELRHWMEVYLLPH